MTKFCKDCKWARPSTRVWKEWPGLWAFLTQSPQHRLVEDWEYAKCERPGEYVDLPPDLVTGEPRRGRTDEHYTFCNIERASPPSCGPEGKFWEAKE